MESKPLSDKQLLRKASSKITATDFLETYSEHIRATYPAAVPILDKLAAGEYLPTPTLEMLKHVIFASVLEGAKKAGAEARVREEKPAKTRTGITGTGKYVCQIFVGGELLTDKNGMHTFNVDLFQDAERLVDRKMVDIASDSFATITSGDITTKVSRDDSLSRFFRERKGAVCKVKPTSAPLKNTMSCHQDTASFSHG